MTSAGATVVAAATATGAAAAATGGNATLSARKSGEAVRISVAVQTANRTDGKPHTSRVPAKKSSLNKTSKLPMRVVIEPKCAQSVSDPDSGKTQISESEVAAAGLLSPAQMTIDILRRPDDQQDVHSMPESGLLIPVSTANTAMPFPLCIDSPDGHKADGKCLMSAEDIVCDKDNYVLFDYPDRFINEHAIYSRVKEADDDEDEGEVEEEDSRSSSSSSCKNHDMMVQEAMVSNPDPGYGSEKSPDDDDEEETITKCIVTSPITPLSPCSPNTLTNVSHQDSSTREDDILDDFFKFVPNENIFKVVVHKTAQGLGLSVTGGAPAPAAAPSGAVAITSLDSGDEVGRSPAATSQFGGSASWSGLIRIKKIFPHGAAWQTGQLAVGDVLLAANAVALTGSTNYEALEVLRCSPRETELLVCRIPSDIADKMGLHPPESPASSGTSFDPSSSHSAHWLSPVLPLSALGEFEISMTKVNGSLGFTLRKEDESILGHYIRSLVKEPAISDGRIKPGDKIISVNNVDMSTMSHAEAVAFLRRCPETVTIRLFRDSAVTPLSPLSPTEPECSSLNRPRPLLRQEAQDLLHDLAVRKQSNSRGGSPAPLSGSPCSPRRRRLTKTPSPDLAAVVRDRYGSNHSMKDSLTVPHSSSGSPPMSPLPEMDTERDGLPSGLDLTDSSSFHTPTAGTHQRATRPDFLDLSNSLVKKQRFMFTPPTDQPPSSFEVRQSGDGRPVDPNESEISEYLTPTRMANESSNWSRSSPPGSVGGGDDSVSLNNESSDRSALDEDTTMNEDEFVSFHSPSIMERFAPQGLSDHELDCKFPLPSLAASNTTGTGKEGLVKWKGVVLTPDEEYAEEAHLGLIQTIELNKGWNSRLGFSVGIGADGYLVISAIYDDSVAAKDGRLEVGDRVLRVNGEKLEGSTKEYVIDILRKTRGPVAITVRKAA